MSNHNLTAKNLITLTAALAFFIPATAALADENISIRSQCQNDAREFGIEAEFVQQYVSDCIVSLGGEESSAGDGNLEPSQGQVPDNQDERAEQEQSTEQSGDVAR